MNVYHHFHHGSIWNTDSPNEPVLITEDLRIPLKNLSSGVIKVFQHMCLKGATLPEFEDIILEEDGVKALAGFLFLFEQIKSKGLICMTLYEEQRPMATLSPSSPHYQETMTPPPQKGKVSRFAHALTDKGQMILESVASHCRLLVYNPYVMVLFHAFSTPRRLDEPLAPPLSQGLQRELVLLMYKAGIIVETDSDGLSYEDTKPPLSQWEFHDLCHLVNSRQGMRRRIFGGSYRFRGVHPPPATQEKPHQKLIPLYTPNLEDIENTDPPFAMVCERRRSTRSFGTQPISLEQLGEFLFRVARTRGINTLGEQALLDRPYPSGGAIYELEVYLLIPKDGTLNPGLYHYQSHHHQLAQISDWSANLEDLFENARHNASASNPQILMVITSRIPKLSWKYESIAYALTLKHVGVIIQTMYLNATAMDLGGCALGLGNFQNFAKAMDVNPLEECSMGEFLLGART